MEKMVTRTITTTVAKVLCMDTEKSEAVTLDFNVSCKYDTYSDIIKHLTKKSENPAIIPCKVLELNVTEKLYGMTEQEFIEHAKELPPRAAK